MNPENFPDLDNELKELWLSLVRLQKRLRDHTKQAYNRVNPFYEDLFDWSERASYCVDENKGITIYNSTTIVGDVKIGDNTWIGPFCSLDGNGGLEIGQYCSVSLGCQLVSHDTVKWALSGGISKYEYAKIRIGDCCFLGSYTVINKGVEIGNHCVIGAGSVVTKNVDHLSIVAGVPAKKIGSVKINNRGEVKLCYK